VAGRHGGGSRSGRAAHRQGGAKENNDRRMRKHKG
jgi:hypothetical protein